MPKRQITTVEPADRPWTIALSDAEILALVKYHTRQINAVKRQVGKAVSEIPRKGNNRVINATIDKGQQMILAHASRAKGLVSIIK